MNKSETMVRAAAAGNWGANALASCDIGKAAILSMILDDIRRLYAAQA